MRMRQGLRAALLLSMVFAAGFISLDAEEVEAAGAPCIVETSLWMIANLLPNPPDFYQLGLGFRLDEMNVLYLNGMTWTYPAPLGIPFGPNFEPHLNIGFGF